MADPRKSINFSQGIAVYNATAPTFNDREVGGLQLDINGNTKVVIEKQGPKYTSDDLLDNDLVLTDANETELIAAQGAGNYTYITSMSISNTSGTDVRIDIKKGSTVVKSFMLAATGGGAALSFPAPWKIGDNTALNVQLSGAVTDVRVGAEGFKSTDG